MSAQSMMRQRRRECDRRLRAQRDHLGPLKVFQIVGGEESLQPEAPIVRSERYCIHCGRAA